MKGKNIRRRDVASYIDALWQRIGQGLKSAGTGTEDLAKAAREARKSKARDGGRR